MPPFLQVLLGLGLLALAWWAYKESQVTAATDAWIYNSLSVISGLAGLLWLPFAFTALGIVVRNRRRRQGVTLH